MSSFTHTDLPALMQWAVSAYQSGRFDEAGQACAQVLAADPKFLDAVNLMGAIALGRGNAEAALEYFSRAVEIRPRFADSHSNRGAALQKLGRWDEALAAFKRALDIDPLNWHALYNRGVALSELKRWKEAFHSFDRVVRARPDHVAAWNNRGNVLQELERWPEALQSYERALQLRPDHKDALNNRGVVLLELGRPNDALASFERAVAIDPQFGEAQWCKAMTHLRLGQYGEGWKLYEWRWRTKSPPPARDFREPLWVGQASIAGRTLLLHADEGFGDTIQMARYAVEAERAGANVVLEVYPPLARLMSSLSPTIRVVERGAPLPAFDAQCPLGSAPLAFHTTVESIPRRSPYLYAPPFMAADWGTSLGPAKCVRVGIAWSGNVAHRRDRERSIAIERLLALFDERFELHVLQKDVRDADREIIARDGRIRLWGDRLRDFADTAALAANIDLVVSVDTSVAHLACAIGRPTWILLAYVSDHRWLLDRVDSPWYPTARLFRQPRRGDWDGALAAAGAALAAQYPKP